MTADQISKANADLRYQSALDSVSFGDGTQASACFNVRCDVAQEIPGPLSVCVLKRRERPAPRTPSVGLNITRLSLTPGFSRVICAVNEGNGFNRFLRATAAKPLKRLGRRPRLLTGLKPGANERPRGSSLPLASQKRHREPEQTKRLCE